MTASCGMLSARAKAKIDRSDGGNSWILEDMNISWSWLIHRSPHLYKARGVQSSNLDSLTKM